jgi:Lysozyme like domain
MVPAHPMTPTPPAPATSTTYAPSFSVKQALVNAGATPQEATTLTAVSGAESGFGKSPVSPQNKDGSRDYGYFQINNHAWPQFGGAAVASKPLSDQAAAALHIYRTQGPGAWTTYKTGAYKSYLGKDATGPGAAAPPGTTLNTPPPAASIANALTGGTGANGQGLSPIQQAQKDVSGEGGQALPPAAAPQLGMPNMHNQQVEAQAPQLMAALRTAAAQPLSWGSQPFGSTAGPRGGATPQTMANFGGQLIPMPGTTLNSNAGLYG